MTSTASKPALGVVVSAFLAMAATYFTLAGGQFILTVAQVDLGFTIDEANALTFAPAAASLVIVFLAGSLADRWGSRPMLLGASALFTLGALLVCVAPSLTWIIIGRLLDGIGGVTMTIVGLSVINTAFSEPTQRARIFAAYAAVTPAVFFLSPPLAALLVESFGWRVAVIPWVIIGALTFVTSLRFVPRGHEGKTGELATPLCAGLVLAGIALGAMNVNSHRGAAAIAFVIAAVALVLLVVLLRRFQEPTFNIKWVREPGVILLIVILFLTIMPNLFFYTSLLLQYRYTMSLTGIALLLMVPQAFAVAGGLLSAPVSERIGPARAVLVGLAATSISCLGQLLVRGDSPIWVPVLTLSFFALPFSFVVGPLTSVLLSRAPKEASGTASALRKATTNVASVFGGLILGTLAFDAFQSKLVDILGGGGMAADLAQQLAKQIRDGAVVDQLADELTDPFARDALISKGPGLLEAQSYAFAVCGLMSAGVFLLATALMALYVRRAPQAVEVEAA